MSDAHRNPGARRRGAAKPSICGGSSLSPAKRIVSGNDPFRSPETDRCTRSATTALFRAIRRRARRLLSFDSMLATDSCTRAFVDWTPDRADVVARGLGIVLGPEQWRVIACARELEATAPGRVHLDELASRLGKPLAEIRRLFPEPLVETLRALAGLTR
jgi:hypothetical protein